MAVAHQEQKQSHLSLDINDQLPYFFLDKPTVFLNGVTRYQTPVMYITSQLQIFAIINAGQIFTGILYAI